MTAENWWTPTLKTSRRRRFNEAAADDRGKRVCTSGTPRAP